MQIFNLTFNTKLLLEVIYGERTLIRDIILSMFYKSKHVQFLTLLNLFDNYIPMVLSIYSIWKKSIAEKTS